MNEPILDCKHEKLDEYGVCEACGVPTRLYPYQLYVIKSSLLELERGRETISASQYAERKAKLDFIKDYCIKNDLWHPTMKDLCYPKND